MSFIMTKWCSVINKDNKEIEFEISERQKEKFPFEFRLLDDDGIIYGYGISKTNDDNNAFAPLDFFQPDYGCTEIQYKNNDIWETL